MLGAEPPALAVVLNAAKNPPAVFNVPRSATLKAKE